VEDVFVFQESERECVNRHSTFLQPENVVGVNSSVSRFLVRSTNNTLAVYVGISMLKGGASIFGAASLTLELLTC
jgi:hypothetical protein